MAQITKERAQALWEHHGKDWLPEHKALVVQNKLPGELGRPVVGLTNAAGEQIYEPPRPIHFHIRTTTAEDGRLQHDVFHEEHHVATHYSDGAAAGAVSETA